MNHTTSEFQSGAALVGRAGMARERETIDHEAYRKAAAQAKCAGLTSEANLDVQPQREIPQLVQALSDRSDRLGVSLARLEGRLLPVLVNVPSTAAEGKSCGSATGLGEALRQILTRLELMDHAIRQIEEHLEL